MESLEFLCILIVGLSVAIWYFQNERNGANGELGLLAIKPDIGAQPGPRKKRYRMKQRRATRARDRRNIEAAASAEAAQPAYRQRDETAQARRRFRQQDEARYRVKDKMADDFTLREADD